MTSADKLRTALIALVWLLACPGPDALRADVGSADTTDVVAGGWKRGEEVSNRFFSSPTDTIESGDFRRRNAFSLGHFFQMWPRLFVGRYGPIGARAQFSRYGVGSGHGVLYLGTVALNDPQDGRVPLDMVPTTALGRIAPAGTGDLFFADAASIEGAYHIAEPEPPSDKPVAAIEFSRGDRKLRQRRVRLSSIEGPIGIDFEFDELLNNGYTFDARDIISGGGRTSARVQGGNVRGTLSGGVDYLFSLREFESEAVGDLREADALSRREGHLAVIRTSFDGTDLSIFEKAHEVTTPDSATSNHTAGAILSVPFEWGGRELSFGAGYEDIHSSQRMGSTARSRLQRAHLGAAGRSVLPAGFGLSARVNATHHFDGVTGWGGGIKLTRALGASHLALFEVHRRFRMPTLGELFEPRHSVRTYPIHLVTGNPSIDEETAVEGIGAWAARWGGLRNEVRATAMRVRDPILYQAAPGNATLFRPQNGAAANVYILEDRVYFQHTLFGAVIELAGSFEYALGRDEGPFFSGVPEYRSIAWAGVERDFFEGTSNVRVSAEYERCGRRKAGSIDALEPFGVVNLKLVVRLIDAYLYIQWLNVTDEKYQTVWPYWMTPQTFVYGVQWSIFD
jgi:hypothetical protein